MKINSTRKETKEIIVKLDKKAKQSGKKIWKALALALAKPASRRAKVNVHEINKLAAKNEGKVFVIPGKLLATGIIEAKVEAACFDYSEKAREKIENAKGKVMKLDELIDSGVSENKMVILK